jgi:hypothetical protein
MLIATILAYRATLLPERKDTVTGTALEHFGAGGSETAPTGTARPMSAACRRVAALH